MLKKNEIGPQTYRDAMARFAGAVHVVTTDGVAGKRGATVIATCSVSDSPPTVLVCLNRENLKNEAFIQNGNFALNTLAADQQALAEAFSGQTGLPVEERFALAEWDTHFERRADAARRARGIRLRDHRHEGPRHASCAFWQGDRYPHRR